MGLKTRAPSAALAKTAPKSTAPKKAAPKKTAPRRTPAAGRAARPVRQYGKRADLGRPVNGFFARQRHELRPILDELRSLIAEAAPGATASLKWGMPFYVIGRETVCAVASFKSHVNLILPGPPGTYADPGGLLEGDGKTGRHLKLRAGTTPPRAELRDWLATAARRASTAA